MKNLQIFESFSKRSIVLESRQKRKITFDVEGGKIQNIVNESGVRFPYHVGEHYNRNIENWCCNNGFTMNGEDMCPEEKLFGVKVSQYPKGSPERLIFPKKFRK